MCLQLPGFVYVRPCVEWVCDDNASLDPVEVLEWLREPSLPWNDWLDQARDFHTRYAYLPRTVTTPPQSTTHWMESTASTFSWTCHSTRSDASMQH